MITTATLMLSALPSGKRFRLFACLLGSLFPGTLAGQTADLSSLFRNAGVDGSTTVFDHRAGRWLRTDENDSKRESLPASTFKIVNSLIALEERAVADENETIAWDGVERGFNGTLVPAWNRDNNLASAFANSTVWFHENLAGRIGHAAYEKWLPILGYGNGDLKEEGVNFWVRGNFGVTPDQQIHLLAGLFENKLPFSKTHQATVRKIMLAGRAGDMTVRGKTGWTNTDNLAIGWWVGYLEMERADPEPGAENDVFFFATRITTAKDRAHPRFGPLRKELTWKALEAMNVLNAEQAGELILMK